MVELIGVNERGEESGNDTIGEEASLPWLQDTAEVDAWGLWQADWRDVVVLDRDNAEVGRMNLTDYDLADPDNVQRLRDLLSEAGASEAGAE